MVKPCFELEQYKVLKISVSKYNKIGAANSLESGQTAD
jgi:hypothetical protein